MSTDAAAIATGTDAAAAAGGGRDIFVLPRLVSLLLVEATEWLVGKSSPSVAASNAKSDFRGFCTACLFCCSAM